MNWIFEPWAWYISGPLITLIMLLLLLTGKNFGMSSNLRTLCTICGAGRASGFFRFDWRSQKWNLIVVLGAIIGGFLGSHYLSSETKVAISDHTVQNLETLEFKSAGNTYLPVELF